MAPLSYSSPKQTVAATKREEVEKCPIGEPAPHIVRRYLPGVWAWWGCQWQMGSYRTAARKIRRAPPSQGTIKHT
jgi:hypothetical protein